MRSCDNTKARPTCLETISSNSRIVSRKSLFSCFSNLGGLLEEGAEILPVPSLWPSFQPLTFPSWRLPCPAPLGPFCLVHLQLGSTTSSHLRPTHRALGTQGFPARTKDLDLRQPNLGHLPSEVFSPPLEFSATRGDLTRGTFSATRLSSINTRRLDRSVEGLV
jgi:hypothetical protein